MKGFGFPTNNEPNFKADTSKKKQEVINILQKSEQLWNEEGKQEESKSLLKAGLIYLRKGITFLEFIIENEDLEMAKVTYSEKLKELRNRLQNRQSNKEEQSTSLLTQSMSLSQEGAKVAIKVGLIMKAMP